MTGKASNGHWGRCEREEEREAGEKEGGKEEKGKREKKSETSSNISKYQGEGRWPTVHKWSLGAFPDLFWYLFFQKNKILLNHLKRLFPILFER